MAQKLHLRAFLFKARYVYILVYMLFTALNKFIPFVTHADSSIGAAMYNCLAILGAVLLAADFFTKRNMFRVRYNGVLLLFFCAYLLSAIYNIKYGWADNAKTLVWMLIQTFMLMAMDIDQPIEAHKKYMHIIFNAYIGLWLAGVIWSLGQYVTQYYMPHVTATGDSTPEGFLAGRLFGVFTDPNVGAVCSIIALLLAVYLLKCKARGTFGKVYYWGSVAANVIYVILSGSRTGELILLCLAAVAAIFVCISRAHSVKAKWYAKTATSALLVILCVALTFGGMRVLKTGLSYVPGVYSKFENMLQQPDTPEKPTEGEKPEKPNDQTNLERPDVVGSEDISNARFKIWKDALKLVEVSPVLGTSARNHLAFAKNHFGEDMFIVRRGYSVHNGYLSLLTYTGLLGAGIMILWMGSVVAYILGYLIRRRKTQDQYYKPVMYLTLALFSVAASAFPMMGIFFGNSVIEVMFWLIMGYTLYMVRVSDQTQNTKEPVLYRISEFVVRKLSKKRKA